MRYVFKKPWKRIVACIFDLMGSLIFFWLRFLPRPRPFHRILLIRVDQLGDLIFTTPAIRRLRQAFPGAEIDFLGPALARELFAGHEALREVLVFEKNWFYPDFSFWACLRNYLGLIRILRRRRYDLAIDFRGDIRLIVLMFLSGIPERIGYGITGGSFLLTHRLDRNPEWHEVESNLKIAESLGCPSGSSDLEIPLPKDRDRSLENLLGRKADGERPRIVIHPGSGYPSKRWSTRSYEILIEKVLSEGLGDVILVGSKEEKQLLPSSKFARDSHFINLMGKTTLTELCAVLSSCELFVGNDSGPAHLAAALGKKLVVVFSGTNESRHWRPWSRHCALLRYPVFCSPCAEKVCVQPRHYCMEGIPVDDVLFRMKEAIR